MPNYYNNYQQPPYGGYSGGYIYGNQTSMNSNAWGNNIYGTQQPQGGQWMINVDGEVGAKAWQMPNNLPPNTVIPLFDLDGEHVYFRSVDAYGRMNPLRKGRVVFEDEPKALPNGQSGNTEPITVDPDKYATKEDFNELKNEIRELTRMNQSALSQQNTQTNQNGNRNRDRGDNR